MEDPITRPVLELEETLPHVHIALMPDPESLSNLALLQARVHRSLPQEHAKHIAWVPPEFFGIVLAYIGCIRVSLLEILHDIMKDLFRSEVTLPLQAYRFATAHDAQGFPRLLGVGLVQFDPLLTLRNRLIERLAQQGIETLPIEFVQRIILARLPENAGNIMSTLEGFASEFPITLQCSHVDLANRKDLHRNIWAQVILGKSKTQGTFAKLHGCCREQSNRFAVHGGLDCPMRNVPEYILDCFETGCTPTHPPETPADAKVDAEIVHEGTQDLLRFSRNRLSTSLSKITETAVDNENEKIDVQQRPQSTKKEHQPPLSVNHRNPQSHDRSKPDVQKKPKNREVQQQPREQEKNKPSFNNANRHSRRNEQERQKNRNILCSQNPPEHRVER